VSPGATGCSRIRLALAILAVCTAACETDGTEIQDAVATGGLLLAPVQVGGVAGSYLVDTGTNLSLVSEETGARLRTAGSPSGRTLVGREAVPMAEVRSDGIRFGGSLLRYPEQLGVLDLGFLASHLDRPVDGILGWDILQQYRLAIDRSAGRLIASRQLDAHSALRRLNAVAPAAVLALEIVGGRPTVRASTGDRPLRLLLDTGSDATTLFAGSWSRLGLPPPSGTTERRRWKVTGITTGHATTLHDLRLGSVALADLPVVIADEPRPATSGWKGLDGIIGMDLLTRFVVAIDGPGLALHLAERVSGGGDDSASP